MAKPAQLPIHASDATFTSGPDVGGATKIEPAAGVKSQGFVPGVGFGAQWWNWTLYKICEWIAWIDSQMPEDGTRVVYVPAMSSSGAFDHSASAVLTTANRASQYFDLSAWLPSGATLVGVRAIVKPVSSSGAGDEMDLSLYKTDLSRTYPTATSPTTTQIGTTTEPGTNNNQHAQASITGLSEVIDRSENVYYARVRSSNNAGTGAGDAIHGLVIEFTDPGPRNF